MPYQAHECSTANNSETTHLSAIDREHNLQTPHFIAPVHTPETREVESYTKEGAGRNPWLPALCVV